MKKIQLSYSRPKTLLPYMLLFFLSGICGWIWEVFIRWRMDDATVSLIEIVLHCRGVLHGPWVPLYGCGVLLLAAIWFIFRENKLHTILASFISCGILEYVTGYVLETLFHKKYWDYTGFFLNIQGRICFISVFGFGIAGAAFAIFLLPRFLKLFENHSYRLLQKICLFLTLLFTADCLYSITQLLLQR